MNLARATSQFRSFRLKAEPTKAADKRERYHITKYSYLERDNEYFTTLLAQLATRRYRL